jgi:hypothetical protein
LKDPDTKASLAIQLATCYILGFGTSPQFNKAIQWLSQAESMGHPIGKIFGELLHSGLSYWATFYEEEKGGKVLIERWPSATGGNLLSTPLSHTSHTTPSAVLSGAEPNSSPNISRDNVNTYNSCIISSLQAGVLGITPQVHPELLIRCSLGDAKTARRLIDKGVATSHGTSDGLTCLHLLFIFGDEALPVARKILEQWNETNNPNLSASTCPVRPKAPGISVPRY